MVRAMSTKERPSVAVKALVRAKNAARIMKTAPLPKTKKIEKQPIPGKGKVKTAQQSKTINAQVKKSVLVKKHNLRKTVANSRELKLLMTNTSKTARKSTSASKKSFVKRAQSKKKVINSPRVAPVKPLPKKNSLPKSVKKVNVSKPKVNPPEMVRVVVQYPSSKTSKKSSKSKSKPKVVKPANTANPTDTAKVIKVIKVKKPTVESMKKSVTFVLQKKERRPSRYFELLAKNPAQSRERVLPISQQVKQHARKDALSLRNQPAENDDQHNETRQEDQQAESRLTATKSMKTIAELEKIKKNQSARNYLLSYQRKEQEWNFDVLSVKGSYSNNFKVTISTILKCNCVDYRSYRKICKHITFVVNQVAKDYQLIDEFQATKMILSASFQRLDNALVANLRARMSNGIQNVELKIEASNEVEEKDCPICFCQMEIIEKIDNCMACKKYFHQKCLSVWKTVAKACPLCRNEFSSGKAAESLEKIEEVLA